MSNSKQLFWQLHEIDPNNIELLSLWKELLEQSPNSPIANRAEFILPLMKNQFPSSKIYLAVCYLNGNALTALPMSLSKQHKYGFNWHELGTPFHPHVNLFNFPNSVHTHYSHQQLFQQLIKSAAQWPLKWHRLVVRNLISNDSFKYSHYAGDMAWFDISSPANTAKKFNTSECLNPLGHSKKLDVSQVVSKKLCKNFRRLERKLHKEVGDFELITHQEDDLLHYLDCFFRLEEESWKTSDKVAVKGSPSLEKFYQQMIANFSSQKAPRIFFYQSGKQIIAGALGFVMKQTLYVHKICYLAEFHPYAPGSLLMFSIIQSVLEMNQLNSIEGTAKSINPIKSVNQISLVTSPPWADRWHPNKQRLANLVFYNISLKGQMCRMIDPVLKKIRPLIKRLYYRFFIKAA